MSHPATRERLTTGKQRRAAAQAFSLLMDRAVTHVRVDQLDAADLRFVGSVWDLHGPDGCCTCCPRRVTR